MLAQLLKTSSIGAGGLGFDLRAGQIGHSVASGSPSLRRFFAAVLLRRLATEIGPATRYTFRLNTPTVIKILFLSCGARPYFIRRLSSEVEDQENELASSKAEITNLREQVASLRCELET